MKVIERPCLEGLNTFGVSASAGLLLTLENEEDVLSLPAFSRGQDLVLGGGSNVLLVSDVPGAVYLNRIRGIDIVDDRDGFALVEVGAGENWHRLVRWTLDQELFGLENLSLIPGLAGAAPVQNIGAYGVELSSVIENVTAWDWKRGKWRGFSREDCHFGYRDSRFKTAEPDRYLITSIRLKLSREFEPRLDYNGLWENLSGPGSRRPTAREVSDAVIRIRRNRLPDPEHTGNAGSFFKNPVLSCAEADQILSRHPGLPSWPAGNGRSKLSAAWMIEKCGLKGTREGDAGVSGRHALVLVNHGSARGSDIAALARKVRNAVNDEFGILLDPEPKLVDFSGHQ